MANKKVGVSGIEVFRANSSRVKKAVRTEILSAVTERTKQLYEDLDVAMEGRYPGRHTRRNAASGRSVPGSGLDVPGTSLEQGMIGEFSGRMRRLLQQSVRNTKMGAYGEVGFGKQFRSYGGAASNALNWGYPDKDKNPTMNVVTSPEITPDDDNRQPSTKPPEEYVPQVLLGTDGHVGRNILRLALYEDIQQRRTLKKIEAQLKTLFSQE